MQDLFNQLFLDQFLFVALPIALLLMLLSFHAATRTPMIRITQPARGQLNLTIWGAPLLHTDPCTARAIAAFLSAGTGNASFHVTTGALNVTRDEDGSAALHVRPAENAPSTTIHLDARERQQLVRALQHTPLTHTLRAA